MKNLLLIVFISLLPGVLNAQNSKNLQLNTPGTLSAVLTSTEKITIRNLTLTGSINAADFKCLRDEVNYLTELDLTNATIAAYNGEGTNGLQEYAANAIPDYAFNKGTVGGGMQYLTTIYLPVTLQKIGTYAFAECKFISQQLQLPPTVTEIGNYAFFECSKLTGGLSFSNTLKKIGNYAFKDCTGLAGSLLLGQGVTSIGTAAFQNCMFTGDLLLPNSLTTLSTSAFRNCTGFNGVLELSGGLTVVGSYVFSGCSGFSGQLQIPAGVTRIDSYAFDGCSGLSGNLTFPATLTTIGSSAFKDCSGFSGGLVFPEGLTVIGDYAFMNCTGLTGTLTLPSTVRTLSTGAFYNCSSLTGTLNIPSSVSTLGGSAFQFCRSFTGKLILPNSITTIGNYTFEGCNGFTGELVLPESLTSIGKMAFENCTGLQGLVLIPESTTTIMERAFKNCTGIAGLYLPGSITSIMNFAFDSCVSLSRIASARSVPLPVNPATFANIDAAQCILEVPVGSKASYAVASVWSWFSQVLENNVASRYDVSVKHNTHGTVQLNNELYENNQTEKVTRATVLNLIITPNTGYKVTSVHVNSTDVTHQLAGNSLSIPKIYENKLIEVVFSAENDPTTNVPSALTDNVQLLANQAGMLLRGLEAGDEVTIFSSNGQLRYSGSVQGEQHFIPTEGKEVLIVSIPSRKLRRLIIL